MSGPAGGTPLLLLEGMGGDIPGWRRNVPHLASRHQVIAYDFRGQGRSTMPAGRVTMATFVEDTVALLDELRTGPAHVYGQSFGGMVAQELVLSHPASVRSLVLACTSPGPSHAAKLPRRAHVPKGRPYLALYSEEFAREHPDHVRDDLRSGTPQSPAARHRQWQAMAEWTSWDGLGSIACPTLVLHGSQDRVVSVENARILAARIPGAELVILEGAGHVYHSEQPDAADAAVLEFLERVDAGRP